MVRPAVIDLHPVEVNHYLFMISLDKYNGDCNDADDLLRKICVPSVTKNVN